MKKRVLSILLLCCMVLTMMPATVFAADGEVAARASETGGLYEHHEACGADPAGASDTMMPKTRSGAVRPAATQYTYTLHYDANGGSGAPPSQSVTSSEFHVWVPISEIIPTRDGYTFMGWANSRTGKPIYGGNGGYTSCLVVHGYDMSTTIYAIWEVHNHSWGEWTSNGNGTHTRTCIADSSHTETGNCSGGKATSTERAVCETCHTAYGALLQPAKTVITTPPTLRPPAYVGNEYTDKALMDGEAKAEGTDTVVPGTFSFRDYEGGRVYPGENHMVILFTPNDTEAYTTAECTLIVMGTKRKVTRVPDDVIITNKPIGTAFENLGLPSGVKVETNTGASYSPVPVTWDGSTYNPNKYGEQIITGELHVEKSGFTDGVEPTSKIKATARITLIDDRVFTPTLEPPTYSKQLYGGDLCFLVFADKYLSGGTATVNGEPVSGKFTLDKEQKIYGHSLTASTLLQAGPLQLKVIFTPDNLKRYTKAECTVDVNVIPRTFKETRAGHITNEKFGTPFEELNLSDSFSFYAVGDEKDPEGTGMDFGMNVVTSWDSSTYDPHSFEEQTIYGEVNRAELEKYFTIPENADLRAVRKVQLQPDPTEPEITQLPVFRWKNGDFTLPDNTIFTWRKLQVGTYNDEVGSLVGGVAKVKGTDTVAPGTFSFKNAPPFYLRTPGEHDVTVVFTPDDLRLHKPTEITIKINATKNTIRNIDEPDPITDKPFGTPFAELGLPENVCINAVDGAWRWINVAWDESSYDAESVNWQTIIGTPVLSKDDGDVFQQPEPAVTAAIRVKLIDNRPPMPPTIVAESLPDGMEGEAYSNRLTAKGTAPITWSIVSGVLPEGLSLNEVTGEISGTPAGEGTEVFTVMAVNALGEDIKELSITIAKAPETEYAVTVRDDGHGTASASHAKAAAGTEITLTATPKEGYHFKEWQVMSGDVTVKNDKFTMPSGNVEIKAIFEEDAPPTPTEYTVTVKTDGNGTASASHAKAVVGTEITLTATPNAGYHFKEWQVMSGDVTVRDDKFTMPGSDVEVKAIFEEDAPPTPTEYTVTFDGNDGTPSVGSMTTTKQKLTSLPDASRSKHSFNGWYTEKSGGTKITTDTVFSANTTVYAHWTHADDNNPPVNYYTLRFETGGGSAVPGVRETYNTYIDLTKYVPTRHGYTFVGWYSERSLVNKVSNIYLTGDMTVYAGWRAVTIPQTGDSGQMNLWSTALCASFAGCVALIVWKIRRREKKSL
ncbi:InlB B-repeat-containing protein [Hominenteromicrobium sp.]|uniref:InlB B-repeat-containing protein n=1 Tax=Hominenteromicrobium sp. TaxID=3073581 RepID=UPI003AB7A6EC